MKIKSVFGLLVIAVFAFSCKDNSKFPGFEEAPGGVYYKTLASGEEGARQVANGDVISVNFTYTTESDSLIFDSKSRGALTQIKVIESKYRGDVMEGFMLMKEGDSTAFITSADSFYAHVANVQMPPFIKPGTFLKFYFKLEKTQTEDELNAARIEEARVQNEKEQEYLQAYLTENNITTAPKESGIYYIETQAGSGPIVERGQTVRVHYKGMLLDGTVFDASYDRGEPLEFSIGAGQVIRGWDEGIGYMNAGAKATLVIPSQLAYGAQPPPGSGIKPFSTLVFEVELLEIK